MWANVPHSLTPFTIAPLWWIAAIIDINPATYSTFSIQSVHSQVSHSLLWSVNRTAKLQRQLILYQYECNLAVGSWDPKFAAVQHEPRTIPAGNQNPRQTKTKNKKVKIKPCWSIGNAIVFFFWNATPLCDNGTCDSPSQSSRTSLISNSCLYTWLCACQSQTQSKASHKVHSCNN